MASKYNQKQMKYRGMQAKIMLQGRRPLSFVKQICGLTYTEMLRQGIIWKHPLTGVLRPVA